MAKLTRERKNKTVYRVVGESQAQGLIFNRSASGNGPSCVVDDRVLRNFGSCSYMGLERHPALLAGAAAALESYGSQFSFSRAYLDSPLYQGLEEALDQITGRPTLVAPSTTLAHLAALPVLVSDDDVVLIDQFAHASLHMATDLLKGTIVERIRHNRMDLLEERIIAYSKPGRRIWYLCDGVYSMLGDFADFAALRELLGRYPQLHVYADDAHAVSWTGKHGRGAALSHLGDSERVVVALSLNKAFSAAGGALALPSPGALTQIRRCGGPMLFSGPIQPPMLGAAVASAQLHLDGVFSSLQAELEERMTAAEDALARLNVPVATADRTPIFMVQFESLRAAQRAVRELRQRDYYCCLSTFPAVPMDKPSLRFTVSRHNSVAEITDFVAQLADVIAVRGDTQASAYAS